jgi:serpin B
MPLKSLLCAVFACTPGAAPPEPAQPDPTQRVDVNDDFFAQANNAFAVDLWNALQAGRGAGDNLVLSPASVSLALAMTAAGAGGETAQQMAAVLHADDLDVYTASAATQLAAWGLDDQPYELAVANRLFGHRETGFLPAFVDLTGQRFGAPLEPVDFVGAPEPSRERINGWVAERTEQRIEDLLPAGSIDSDTRLVLANAIYFDGSWTSAFDPARTAPAPFRTAEGPVEVQMMHQTASFPYARVDGVQVLELPYEGGHLVLDLVLPDEDRPLGKLGAEDLTSWLSALAPAQVDVSLPRLELAAPTLELARPLAALGMPLAFGNTADFSGMTAGGGLHIDGVYHQTFLMLDEVGTEAAAATGVVMTRETAVARPQVERFVADHPFLFAIRDVRNGAILFLGEVGDPTAARR